MDYIFHCNILSYPKSGWPYGAYPDREEDLCDEGEAEVGLERKVFTLLLPRWFELEVHVPEDFFNMQFNLNCQVSSGVHKKLIDLVTKTVGSTSNVEQILKSVAPWG